MVVSGDGWQGPVSIGIFLGLHALLKDFPGGSGGEPVEVDGAISHPWSAIVN